MMDEAQQTANIRLSSPTWLKYGIAGGTAMFLALAVLSMITYEESVPALTFALVVFFWYLTYRGGILCRFLNAELELDSSTVTLRKGDVTNQLPLTSVYFEFEDWIQIVSVYQHSGDLVFAIDYVGQDIDALRQFALNNG